jgi:hypothetical protein
VEGRSSYEWRNPRGAANRGLEKLEDSPFNLVAPGCELQVAFSAVGEDDAVAVDWPATSGGLYS